MKIYFVYDVDLAGIKIYGIYEKYLRKKPDPIVVISMLSPLLCYK